MIYILYPFLVVINLIGTALTFPLAFLLVLFNTKQDCWLDNATKRGTGPRLIKLLSWFQTPDNSLDGDHTFQVLFPPSWWSRVHWLWRNPAYSFGLKYLETPYECRVQGNKTIKDNDNAKAGWCLVHANGLFQFTLVAPIGFSRCIYVNLGWNIRGLVDVNVNPKPDTWQATFVFSPRISGFR